MPRILASLVPLLVCLLAHAPMVSAQSPSPPGGWLTEDMPYLGFTVRVPEGWERVVGDPAEPVPSIGGIADRDQVTAQALVAAARHIAADGGLLDPMGLWMVDPADLLQFGVLAGQPYRVGVDDLRARVDASVSERASDMGDRVIDPIDLPAATGYRAVYLNAQDLSQHVEYHLRTPTGRYLVLAASLPGVMDEPRLETLDRVARSVAPIPGSAGDRPAPGLVTSSAPANDLLATLPTRVGGLPLDRRLLDGESLVTSTAEATGPLASSLGVLVDAPADLTLAIALPSQGDQALVIAAYALAGVRKGALDEVVGTFPDEVWTRTRLGTTEVLASVRAEDGRRTWLWTGALPDGDAVLYQVDAANATLARAAITAITRG